MCTRHLLCFLLLLLEGDVLSPSNPSKERDIWKWKFESMEHRCSTLQKEYIALYKKAKHDKSLQEEVKTHSSPFTLATWITKEDVSFKEAENRYKYASNIFTKKTHQVEEDWKILPLVAKAHAKDLKTFKDEVVGLKGKLDDSL